MKFIHLSDLHLGKRVNGFSMLEDQSYILQQILHIIEEERPDGVLIAGDVYDRAVPSEAAVELFDTFLTQLSERKQKVFIISGNHDSAERLSFGSALMEGSGIFLSRSYQGSIQPVILEDRSGKTAIWCLPFLRPSEVRRFFPDQNIETYTDALQTVIDHMQTDPSVRNILLTHQFVSGAATCDSENLSVGGTDAVDAAVFAPFDYVALGHLHGPQSVGRQSIRYSGSPLKYSFSEKDQEKSLTVAELTGTREVQIRTIPLKPLRDLRQIRGSYDEIMARSFYTGTNTRDYLRMVLTDEEEIPEVLRKLSMVYPNIMLLEYDNTRTRTSSLVSEIRSVEGRTAPELFDEFYLKQNGQSMSEAQRKYTKELFEKIREEKI